jgi:hypothetical protein
LEVTVRTVSLEVTVRTVSLEVTVRTVSQEVTAKLKVTFWITWEITASLQFNYGLEVTLEENSGFNL